MPTKRVAKSAAGAPPPGSLAAGFTTPYDASFAGLDLAMAFRDSRLQTYQTEENPWPFTEDCECTPEKVIFIILCVFISLNQPVCY